MRGNFSKKELELLYEITSNSRAPLNQIAKKLNLSQQGLSYRISKLEDSNILLNYFTLFDYSCLGYNNFRVFFNLNSSDEASLKKIIDYLCSHSSVLSVNHCGGKWDLMVTFAVKNISKFNKELKSLISQFPQAIKSYSILTNVVAYNYGKRYLSDSSNYPLKVIGGDRDLVKIDSIDQKLIKELFYNPRITYVALSSKYKLNPKTIINKVKALEAKGVIKGYSCVIDCYKFYYLANKILIKYHNPAVKSEEEILKFCKQNKAIINVVKVIGEWDLEIDVENKDFHEFKNLCAFIRSKFGDNIHNFETCSIFSNIKTGYIPASFFSETL